MTMAPSDRDALIVVDMQNDFLPGGSLAVAGGDEIIAPINALGQRFPNVVMTQDWHPAGHISFASSHPGRRPLETIELSYGPQMLWPDHCVIASSGADFAPAILLPHAQIIVRKGFHPAVDSYSGFREADRRTQTGLAGYLRERGFERLFLVGLATDYCVGWTALDARAAGFEVLVVADACRAIDSARSLQKARAEMGKAGVQTIQAVDIAT